MARLICRCGRVIYRQSRTHRTRVCATCQHPKPVSGEVTEPGRCVFCGNRPAVTPRGGCQECDR